MGNCTCCGSRLVANETNLCSACFLRWVAVEFECQSADLDVSMSQWLCPCWAEHHTAVQGID